MAPNATRSMNTSSTSVACVVRSARISETRLANIPQNGYEMDPFCKLRSPRLIRTRSLGLAVMQVTTAWHTLRHVGSTQHWISAHYLHTKYSTQIKANVRLRLTEVLQGRGRSHLRVSFVSPLRSTHACLSGPNIEVAFCKAP